VMLAELFFQEGGGHAIALWRWPHGVLDDATKAITHVRDSTMPDKSVPQRERYDGVAREVATWWRLRREATKGEAVCRVFTHVFGHELRLEVRGHLVESQVCRTLEEQVDCQEKWRAGLEAKGWTSAGRPEITSDETR
jgi:hypothetical protein